MTTPNRLMKTSIMCLLRFGKFTFLFPLLTSFFACKDLKRSNNTCRCSLQKSFCGLPKVIIDRVRDENATAVTEARADLKTSLTNGRVENCRRAIISTSVH